MKPEDVRAMTVGELRIKAAEILGWKPLDDPEYMPAGLAHESIFGRTYCYWKRADTAAEELPDYLNDWNAAMELLESAKRGRDGVQLWDFYQALEALIDLSAECGDGMKDAPITGLCLLGHLTPRLVAEAFVLAASKEGNDDSS